MRSRARWASSELSFRLLPEAQCRAIGAAQDVFIQAIKGTAADEQDVGGIDLDELLLGGCLRPPLGGTLLTVPSRIFSSACCTPSPPTSR